MRTKILTEHGWTFRGRPRGRLHSHADTKLLEYLTEISVRYGIDSNEFFGKFVEAWENQESTCKKLTIECRGKTRDCAIFLITTDYKVIAQFPIPEHLLREINPLKEFGYVLEYLRRVSMKGGVVSKATHLQIKDLKAGMKQVSLKARIAEISKPRLVLTRFNDYAMFANAILSDGTSKITLTLWNGKIKMVSVNDVVQIENADVVLFRGEPQLRIRKNGTIKVLEYDDLTTIQRLQS